MKSSGSLPTKAVRPTKVDAHRSLRLERVGLDGKPRVSSGALLFAPETGLMIRQLLEVRRQLRHCPDLGQTDGRKARFITYPPPPAIFFLEFLDLSHSLVILASCPRCSVSSCLLVPARSAWGRSGQGGGDFLALGTVRL